MIVPSSASLGLATAVSSFLPLEIAAVRPESLHRRVVNKRKMSLSYFHNQRIYKINIDSIFHNLLRDCLDLGLRTMNVRSLLRKD